MDRDEALEFHSLDFPTTNICDIHVQSEAQQQTPSMGQERKKRIYLWTNALVIFLWSIQCKRFNLRNTAKGVLFLNAHFACSAGSAQ